MLSRIVFDKKKDIFYGLNSSKSGCRESLFIKQTKEDFYL